VSVTEQSSGITMSGVTSAATLLLAFDKHFFKECSHQHYVKVQASTLRKARALPLQRFTQKPY